MPLCFFDVHDGERLWKDEFGAEMTDLHEAREQANALLPDLARDKLPVGNGLELSIVVRCIGDPRLYKATLSFHKQWIVSAI